MILPFASPADDTVTPRSAVARAAGVPPRHRSQHAGPLNGRPFGKTVNIACGLQLRQLRLLTPTGHLLLLTGHVMRTHLRASLVRHGALPTDRGVARTP
jgi:hypothetical protein